MSIKDTRAHVQVLGDWVCFDSLFKTKLQVCPCVSDPCETLKLGMCCVFLLHISLHIQKEIKRKRTKVSQNITITIPELKDRYTAVLDLKALRLEIRQAKGDFGATVSVVRLFSTMFDGKNKAYLIKSPSSCSSS